MKKIIIVSLLCCMNLFGCQQPSKQPINDNIITKNAIVIDIDNTDVIFETEDGNIWAFSDNNFSIGQSVNVTFDTLNNANVIDDIILNISSNL